MNHHSGIFSQTNSSVTYKKVACYIKCMFSYYSDSCTTSYIMSGAEKKNVRFKNMYWERGRRCRGIQNSANIRCATLIIQV